MNKTKTTAFSGCLIWFQLPSLIGCCVMPVAFMVGGISSASDVAIKLTGDTFVLKTQRLKVFRTRPQ